MNKSLIIVGTYCPDDERKQLLENCINSLQSIRHDFDILISSHSYISENIANKVDYVFYDKNNDLITDWDYMNLPWFSPFEGLTIVSSLISNYSTYLAAYRIFIGALGLAKTFQYKKVHYVEYDSIINDHSDLYENDILLENNVSIQYVKNTNEFDTNNKDLRWGYGCFQSYNLNKLNSILTSYNKEILLDLLKNTPYKTNEKINQDILSLDGEKIFYKNFNELETKGNKFNLSSFIESNILDEWIIPYYDPKLNKVNSIVWNTKSDSPVNVNFIMNQNKLVEINNVAKFTWCINELGDLNDINEILIIVNNKIKNHIIINTLELKEKFKRNNEARYSTL